MCLIEYVLHEHPTPSHTRYHIYSISYGALNQLYPRVGVLVDVDRPLAETTQRAGRAPQRHDGGAPRGQEVMKRNTRAIMAASNTHTEW